VKGTLDNIFVVRYVMSTGICTKIFACNCQVKSCPTQPNFKPYPTQANFKPYPTQAQSSYPVVAGGGIFTQPGQPPASATAVVTNFCDAVASLYAESIEEYITKNPDCLNERGKAFVFC